MTKEQKKRIIRLVQLRKKAGERLMKYDAELTAEFAKMGVDIGLVEGGNNSVYLITEPNYCEKNVLDVLKTLEKDGD